MGQKGRKVELQISDRTLEYAKRLISVERLMRWTPHEENRLKERLYKGCERYVEDFRKWLYDMALNEDDDTISKDTIWTVFTVGDPWRYVDTAREEGLLVVDKRYTGENKIEIHRPYLQNYKIGELEPIVRHLLRLEKKVTRAEMELVVQRLLQLKTTVAIADWEHIVQYLLLLEKTTTMRDVGPIVRHLALLEKNGKIQLTAPPAVPTPEQDSNPDVDPDFQALCDADF